MFVLSPCEHIVCKRKPLLTVQKCSPDAQLAKGKKALVEKLQSLQAAAMPVNGPESVPGVAQGAAAKPLVDGDATCGAGISEADNTAVKSEGSRAATVDDVNVPVVTGLVASGALDIDSATDLAKLTVRLPLRLLQHV
jgi:hypothetical protein